MNRGNHSAGIFLLLLSAIIILKSTNVYKGKQTIHYTGRFSFLFIVLVGGSGINGDGGGDCTVDDSIVLQLYRFVAFCVCVPFYSLIFFLKPTRRRKKAHDSHRKNNTIAAFLEYFINKRGEICRYVFEYVASTHIAQLMFSREKFEHRPLKTGQNRKICKIYSI